MPSWRKVTEQDKKDMFDLFESGMSTKEVVELTGWKQNTVYSWRKRWKKQKSKSTVPVEEVVETAEEKPAEEDISDYAKAYMADHPAGDHGIFDVERIVRIKSRRTGILYEVDREDHKKLKISLPDGKTLDIEIELFDMFVDEGIDVLLELKRTA